MIIGVPKEIKKHEYRVAASPEMVRLFRKNGQEIVVESGAGLGSGYLDEDYRTAGARVVDSAEAVFAEAGLILKVKEPQPAEWQYLRREHILFTYLHLASDPGLTRHLMETGTTAIAYETIQMADGSLPCLEPMSVIAGRLAVQSGAHFLESPHGGKGMLMGGVAGIQQANVLIIGGGTAGTHCAETALGLGAMVTVLEVSWQRMEWIRQRFQDRVRTEFSSEAALQRLLPQTDLLISSILIPGAAAPRILRREHFQAMPDMGVFIDISIDQGGSSETSRPTSHDDPVYLEESILHYCVTNIPGAVARTSTLALNGRIAKYALALAHTGLEESVSRYPELQKGINVLDGALVHPAVAAAFGTGCRELTGAF